MQFSLQFFIENEFEGAFFHWENKGELKFQYQQSTMSYKNYIELQN